MGSIPKPTCGRTRSRGLGLEGIRFRLHYQDEISACARSHDRAALGPHRPARRRGWSGRRADLAGDLRRLAARDIPNCAWSPCAPRPARCSWMTPTTPRPNPCWLRSTCSTRLDGRKIAVLGDMLELGPYERQGHEMVGMRAAEVADVLVTLGNARHMIADAARTAGMKSGPASWNSRTSSRSSTGCEAILPRQRCRPDQRFARFAHGPHRRCAGGAVDERNFPRP